MFNKIFRLDLDEASKDVYIWAILSGMLYSGSTFLISIVAARAFGAAIAGIYTFALTNGNQLITIGYWNTRTYQASDVREKVAFSDYFALKVLTTLMMIIIGLIWIFVGGFDRVDSLAMIIMTIFKCIEVFGDVFEGRYQQKRRFDISSKSLLIRTTTFILAFCMTAIITRNLIASLIVMTICYAIAFLLVDARLIKYFGGLKIQFHFPDIGHLAWVCFPLFVNSFLLMYINQAAKMSVAKFSGKEVLTAFNALFMIAFVINMFSSVILKPMINQLSELFLARKIKEIIKILSKQTVLIIGLTIVCLIGAYLVGTQILSIVYGINLTIYKKELCILIIGGSCTAMYQVFQNMIIVMRHQYSCLIGCILTALFTFVITPMYVESMGISGGAISYLFTMALMSLIYGMILAYFMYKER